MSCILVVLGIQTCQGEHEKTKRHNIVVYMRIICMINLEEEMVELLQLVLGLWVQVLSPLVWTESLPCTGQCSPSMASHSSYQTWSGRIFL